MRTDDVARREDVRANRRWLIGITITLVFGLFGAIMALLAYTNTVPVARTSRPAASRPKAGSATTAPPVAPPPTTASPAAAPPAASPVEPAKEERRGKKHDRN